MGYLFRTLRADEIDVRIATVKSNGVSLLLYKNARCDMNILDETVGAFNWEREHYECKGNLYCKVSIKRESDGEWISKSDCGTESYTEKEKGEASDSFKRACFNWGIGRELYTAPFILVTNCEIVPSNGKFCCYNRFEVKEIGYTNDNKINKLIIINEKGIEVFKYFKSTETPIKKYPKPTEGKPDYWKRMFFHIVSNANIDVVKFCEENNIDTTGDEKYWEDTLAKFEDKELR